MTPLSRIPDDPPAPAPKKPTATVLSEPAGAQRQLEEAHQLFQRGQYRDCITALQQALGYDLSSEAARRDALA